MLGLFSFLPTGECHEPETLGAALVEYNFHIEDMTETAEELSQVGVAKSERYVADVESFRFQCRCRDRFWRLLLDADAGAVCTIRGHFANMRQ